MLVNKRDRFLNYIEENKYNNNKKASLLSAYKKMERWEITKNKELVDFTKDELLDLCKEGTDKIANRSYSALQVMMDTVNEILRWAGKVDTTLSMRDINADKVLLESNDRFFTRQEIQNICLMLENAQDKFIIYGLYCGIYGKGYSDLLELKIEDLDMENRIINCPSGEVIHMDAFLYEIIKDTIDPLFGSYYYKHIEDYNVGTTTDFYELNMDSPYVLKAKPYSRNNNGMSPMKLNGIQRRLKKLSEVTGYPLSGTDLIRSGIMDKMNEREEETGESWTCVSLENYLKQNNLKGQVYEIYRTYNNKYKS